MSIAHIGRLTILLGRDWFGIEVLQEKVAIDRNSQGGISSHARIQAGIVRPAPTFG